MVIELSCQTWACIARRLDVQRVQHTLELVLGEWLQ